MLSPEPRATIGRINAWQRWHLRDMIEPSRRPFRRYFRLLLEFPRISPNYRSMRFRLVLPGLIVDYRENFEDFGTLGIESGCRVFIFNPFQVNGEFKALHGRAIVDAMRETQERVEW